MYNGNITGISYCHIESSQTKKLLANANFGSIFFLLYREAFTDLHKNLLKDALNKVKPDLYFSQK